MQGRTACRGLLFTWSNSGKGSEMISPAMVRQKPRSAARYEEPSDILIPALAKLRQCKDSMDVLIYIDTLPEIVLPALAWAASRKTYIPSIATKTLVQYCGAFFFGAVPWSPAHA